VVIFMSVSPDAVRVCNSVSIKMEDLGDVDRWDVVRPLVDNGEEVSE